MIPTRWTSIFHRWNVAARHVPRRIDSGSDFRPTSLDIMAESRRVQPGRRDAVRFASAEALLEA